MNAKLAGLFACAFVLSLFVAGCGSGGILGPTPTGGGLGKIVFVTDRDGNPEIYSMNVDGTEPTRLTENPAKDGSPDWSEDGKHIAFISDRDTKEGEIYLLNVEDRSVTRLTTNAVQESSPALSPDGQRIAYVASQKDNSQIYVMNADGSGETRLTDGPNGSFFPAWSPDGKRIAYSYWQDSTLDIYVMNADGSSSQRLTESPDLDLVPAWSPDGQRILYLSGKVGDRQVTGFMLTEDMHVFSMGPNGIFDSRLVEEAGIDIMNADGSNVVNLMTGTTWAAPTWSPDGQYIAFVRTMGDKQDIFIVKADGTGETNLTNQPTGEFAPDW